MTLSIAPPEETDRPSEERFTIQQASANTGLSEHNLRYYERVGLLRPVERDADSGHRRYSLQDLDWVRFLTYLRETRMPIAQMRRYAEMRERGDGTARERRVMLEKHRDAVLAQIAELTRCVDVLDAKIEVYRRVEAQQEGEDSGEPLTIDEELRRYKANRKG